MQLPDINSISCIFYDFDGVMTDNTVMVDQDGRESVVVNRSDGLAVSRMRDMGVRQVIVSTETNPVVERRAEKLKIPVVHSIGDKGAYIKSYAESEGIDLSKAIFVGNDLNDIPAFNAVGIKCAPADAEEEILEIADWVSSRCGGRGVIRELYRVLTKE